MRKNLFKKVLALTLASTMAFSMAGCGSKGGSSDAKNDDGTITLVPKIQDPFSEGPEGEYYEKDEWHDLAPEGRELF